MQQTDKYKLNKPGVDDPITPVPLNENMNKIEAAILGEAAERAALDQRVTVLEAKHLAYGWYQGNDATSTFKLGFTPKLVYVCGSYDGTSPSSIVITGLTVANLSLRIIDGGFQVFQRRAGFSYPNQKSTTYIYIAVG